MVRSKGTYNIPPKKTTQFFFLVGKKDEDFKLYLNDHELREAHQYRYLGVIFDKKLTWRPHIEEEGLKCEKKLNILKTLVHSKFCQNIAEVVRIYRSLIQSIKEMVLMISKIKM